jgi:polyphosphate kinase
MDQTIDTAATVTAVDSPDHYINREMSWIEFNRRVFEEAKDVRHPLLERVKFVAIFETNLDEFNISFTSPRSPDGRNASQQLRMVREGLAPLIQEVRYYWRNELLPLLAEQHIHILDYEQLDEDQRAAMREYFEHEVYPVLTPLAFDSVHPFPHISNLSLNLAVVITDSLRQDLFARVKIPPSLPRLVPVKVVSDEPNAVAFVWMEQLIAANLHLLFPGFDVWEAYPFRVLRDADIELQDDEASDLLEYIEQEVRDRRFGVVVDLAINPSMPTRVRDILLDGLEITMQDVTIIDGSLGMGDVMELHALPRSDLKDPPFTPRIPSFMRQGEDIFTFLKDHDLLLHHPFDSFSTVVDFIQAAAKDPRVLAIKQTLYRVGSNAPVVHALMGAVENGEQVAVVVELKARFDEENNIVWAKELERKGVHVVYGVLGLKTHAKVALVIRKDEQGLKRYIHLGTGNYNATTARIYEDLCLITSRLDIGADATELFNSLTGYSRRSSFRKLLVAPTGLREGINERIEREIMLHREHGNGRIIFKMNALIDPAIIQKLYRASQVGVSIDLIIRGMCSLRPGVAGLSENIRVRSLIGRFLEHSRLYYFGNNGHEEIYLGSADMMQRNLNMRVEVLFPLESPSLRAAIHERMLKPVLADTVNAHELLSDGTYRRIKPGVGEKPFNSHAWFIAHPLFEMEDEENMPGKTISIIPTSI